MSRKANQERAARGDFYRNGYRIHVKPGEKVDFQKYGTKFFICGKCRHVFSEALLPEHLKKCQPLGTRCAKCGDMLSPEKFLEHFKECRGLAKELHHAD